MEEVTPNPGILSDVTKIVILALSIALIGLTIIGLVLGFEARSTQNNADSNARALEEVTQQLADVTDQNAALQGTLTCLRQPAFEADAADFALSIITARGLAAVAANDDATLATLVTDLNAGADRLEKTSEVRQLSITECARDPAWVPAP